MRFAFRFGCLRSLLLLAAAVSSFFRHFLLPALVFRFFFLFLLVEDSSSLSNSKNKLVFRIGFAALGGAARNAFYICEREK